MKKAIILLSFFCIFLVSPSSLKASELTIIYTGQANATLFPCHCPAEPAGGLMRRATKIKELRKELQNMILLEAGDSFAGGAKDYLHQSEELDKKRTQVYFTALKIMNYDAVGSDRGNLFFGEKFLSGIVKKTNLALISLNIEGLKPYIIKNLDGLKIAVIGFGGFRPDCVDCRELENFKKLIARLKKEKVEFFIILSNSETEKDFQILKEIPEINCIISSNTAANNQKPVIEAGDALVALSFWQARRISRLDLNIEGSKIVNFQHSELKLTPEVADDADIKVLLDKYPEFKK